MRRILQEWNFMRMLRLVLAIVILVQGIISRDFVSITLGVLFGATAFANIGCCGSNTCTTTRQGDKCH